MHKILQRLFKGLQRRQYTLNSYVVMLLLGGASLYSNTVRERHVSGADTLKSVVGLRWAAAAVHGCVFCEFIAVLSLSHVILCWQMTPTSIIIKHLLALNYIRHCVHLALRCWSSLGYIIKLAWRAFSVATSYLELFTCTSSHSESDHAVSRQKVDEENV